MAYKMYGIGDNEMYMGVAAKKAQGNTNKGHGSSNNREYCSNMYYSQ